LAVVEMDTDATLVGQLADDPTGQSMRALYRRYGGELYGFAYNLLGERELAEELVQDVFTRVWRNARDFDPSRASFRTWLYQIARNRATDMRRRAAVRPPRAGAGTETAEPAELDDRIEQAALRWQVAAALERLSSDHRDIVRLAYFGGLTLREIAESTGTPLGTVKSRAYYALRSLRLTMEEMGVVG
jgi:RNA polymerase sigma-70 factor, ECF subfamily